MSAEQHEETLVQKNIEQLNEEATKSNAGKGKSKRVTPKPRPQGVDPYIKGVLGIAALVVIGALLTVISAFIFGVIDLDQSRPTTVGEFAVVRATAYADGERTAGSTGQLALALIDNNQFSEAERVLTEALGVDWPDIERNQGIMFAYAVLAHRQGEVDAAVERYIYVMENLREDFTRVYNSDESPNWARAFGLHPNYYESAIALSFIYRDKGEYDKEIEMLDIAIEGMPTSADLFVFRGRAKFEQGDDEGATADFNEALRFIPDDEDALKGLELVGGTVND